MLYRKIIKIKRFGGKFSPNNPINADPAKHLAGLVIGALVCRNIMATSFISEHTAEFSLVPSLKRILEQQFEYVAPVFPWLSRELSSISKRLHADDNFYILVMFPRRPKVSEKKKLFVTINGELELFKEVGVDHGVPVIAGCPNSTDFWDLAKCTDHIWLNIGHPDSYDYLISIELLESGSGSLRISDDEIISIVKEGMLHTLDSFEDFIREARYSQPQMFYGSRYKPVYFLIKAH